MLTVTGERLLKMIPTALRILHQINVDCVFARLSTPPVLAGL